MATGLRSRTVLTLFSAHNSVDSHRARLVLANKGVTFDLILVDPQQPPEDLIDLNPYASLPTLADRDLVLYDINVLSEYLDERYPHPPLMPIDPVSRARLRLSICRVQAEWQGALHVIDTGNRNESPAARKRLKEGLLASADLFKAAKFFLNAELSLADCAILPVLWRLRSAAIELPVEAKPINDYAERMFRSAAFQRSLTAEERELRTL